GLVLQPTDVELSWLSAAANRPAQGSASANGLDLAALAKLASHLPLDDAARARLARHAPHGRVFDLKLDWKGSAEDPSALASWNLKSRFEGLGLSALGPVPGIAGINGRVEGNNTSGNVFLDGQAARLELPNVFADPNLELDSLAAEIGWQSSAEGLQVNLKKIDFHNKHAAGQASGSWRALVERPGRIDLDARLSRGSGQAVWRYMPLAVGKNVRDWLQTGIKTGSATDVTLKLHGDLRKFPFSGGKDGVFEVRGKFRDATLRYADSWPEINAIEGELLFAGERMVITGSSGKILGVTVKDVHAVIEDLAKQDNLLTVTGKATGPTAEFLRFIESSPVGERIDHFTEDMRAEGSGGLELKLQLPLHQLENSKVDGNYRFDGNRLTVDKDLPPLTDVRGGLQFSSDHLQARGIRGNLLDMPLSVDVKTAGDGSVQVNAAGEVSIANLRRQFPHPVFDHLAGSTKWSSTVRARKNFAEVKLSSNLLGISSSLPVPFNKTATEPMAFSFGRKPYTGAAAAADTSSKARAGEGVVKESNSAKRVASQDVLDLNLGSTLRMQLQRRHDRIPALITRGTLTLGDVKLPLPENDLAIAVNLPKIDTDFWRKLLASPVKNSGQEKTPIARWPAIQFTLSADELVTMEKNFHNVRVKGRRPEKDSSTRFELNSRELNGSFEWNSAGSGKLSGRIAQFSIPETVATPTVLQETASEVIDRIPALDITVEQLSFKGKPLGTVRIAAQNLDGIWNTQIDAKNEDGTLKASGRWRRDANKSGTDIEFKLDAKSIEKLIDRIGYPDTVKRGSAKLAGNLSWSGSPFKIDYPTLDGKLSLEASGGQFVKLEPGVGRLLGILSLQSLPRRITLDFRDVFSQGFAFDSIGGDFSVERGELETSELQIKGPSAKVLMSGTVNLGTETQDLKVRVQPAVGESIAVGTMIANPVAGAVVWAAQKLFKDPLDQAFAFEYSVTGSWADPKVEKLGQPRKKDPEETK
ncbi:MAG: TIGR02099 family protein, partial [Sulfuritalea sp.]|nr:TIGR02099 family protein [Sulfuritalea sp.]